MDEQRKYAYRYLLYRAMLDIRTIHWLGWRSWRTWIPPFRWREVRRIRYAGAIADWLHNLAFYSARNFQGFEEPWFWRDFERVRSQFPEFGLESYRQEFERHAIPTSASSPEVKPDAASDQQGV